MSTLVQDLRYGWRSLIKRPAFTLVAIATLALGIGANTTIFTLVNAVLLRPLPVASPDELVFLFNGSRQSPFGGASYPDYVDYRDRVGAFSGLIAQGEITVSLGSDERVELVTGSVVSGNYFDVLGVEPALGRAISEEDDRAPGESPVAVISHALWLREFGADPGAPGRPIRLNGHDFTVIGVAPPEFKGIEVFEARDIFVPLAMQPIVRPPRAGFSGDMDPDLLARRSARWLSLVGRLNEGVSIERAEAEVSALASQLESAYPNENSGVVASLFQVDKIDPRAYGQLLMVAVLLMAIVGFVLLIACANVASLLLARASARRREMATRMALGAGRLRLIRQLLVENLVLSSLGGAAGLFLAWWSMGYLKTLPPVQGPFAFTLDYSLDGRVLAFTLVVSAMTGLIFGLAPALEASRTNLVSALKEELAGTAKRIRRFGIRNVLVVSQVALSLILLIGAGLFLRSLWQIQSTPAGFDADRVIKASLNINLLGYTRQRGRDFYREVLERVEAIPGIESAGLARVTPLSGSGRRTTLAVESLPPPETVESPADSTLFVDVNVVSPGFFRSMGITLLRGRDFSQPDTEATTRVVIVNESFARRYFADRAALGERVRLGSQEEWSEIIGVVSDSKYRFLTEATVPFAYQPLTQNHETGMALFARVDGNPMNYAAAIRNEVRALEPALPLSDLQPMAAVVNNSFFAARSGAWLIGGFGLLALMLASVGLYGVMSQVVLHRTREFGIRIALGARPEDVLRLVIKDGALTVLLGSAIGLIGALALTRLVDSFLFGVSPSDPLTFALVIVALMLVGILACYVPARRATRVDPVVALRYE